MNIALENIVEWRRRAVRLAVCCRKMAEACLLFDFLLHLRVSLLSLAGLERRGGCIGSDEILRVCFAFRARIYLGVFLDVAPVDQMIFMMETPFLPFMSI